MGSAAIWHPGPTGPTNTTTGVNHTHATTATVAASCIHDTFRFTKCHSNPNANPTGKSTPRDTCRNDIPSWTHPQEQVSSTLAHAKEPHDDDTPQYTSYTDRRTVAAAMSTAPLQGITHGGPQNRPPFIAPPNLMWARLQSGEWITVTATPIPQNYASPMTAPCWSVPISLEDEPLRQIPQAARPTHQSDRRGNAQGRPFRGGNTETRSGIDPGESGMREGAVDVIQLHHTLTLEQRNKMKIFNRQLLQAQEDDEPIDFTGQNVFETMPFLWCLQAIMETATRRTRISTIIELLAHFQKYSASSLSQINNDLKRKTGAELLSAIKTSLNSFDQIRNEYPMETVQISILLYISLTESKTQD